MKGEVDVILDAIFGKWTLRRSPTSSRHVNHFSRSLPGFSFSPPVRPPFDTLLNTISHSSLPVVSVDIPSGWSVSSGPPSDLPSEGGENVAVLWSDVLVSLTAPKEGVRKFAQAKEGKTRGRHFLGGRFVPK
jgi:NAD(P)H-hydrate epimerase